MLEYVRLERQDGLAVLTLGGPDPLHLLHRKMLLELGEAAETLSGDDKVRVVVLTGEGDRAFSGGVNVREMARLDTPGARNFISLLHRVILGFRTMDPIVIAAINGHCLGGACELAMACDIRIASENATFGLPEIKVGIPSVIEAALMPLLIGTGKARELILLGDPVDAREAERLGMISRVVPSVELQAAVRKITSRLLSYSPAALRWQKRVLRRWLPVDLEAAIQYSIEAFSHCFTTGEPQEAMKAFLEKRPPHFAC
jgi:enoyl-CoA hydratase/carnithine racemase